MERFTRWAAYIPAAVLAALCIFSATVWGAAYAQTPRGLLTVAVFDVGQGDSIYIESPTGVQIVIDGGPDNSLLGELPKVMPEFDRSLDAIIETHPDADHIAGFVDVLKRYEISAFIEPGIPKNTETADALLSEVLRRNIPRYIVRRGMTLDLGGGVALRVLSPDFDVSRLNQNRANEGAIVAQLLYGKVSVLLMADAPKHVERHLLELDGASLKSDVLKVGHHGSRTATADAFAALVRPSIAVISVGARNQYRLPNQEPIDTLQKYGAQVLRTDQAGTVVFHSDGEMLWRAE